MSNHPVQTVNTSSAKIKIVLAVVALVAGIAGFYVLAGQPTGVRAGALIVGLLVALLFAWTSSQGRGFVGFARESVRETKKVVWPTRKEALQMTAIVFVFVLVMAIFLWSADKLLEFVLYDLILGWK